MMSKRGMEKAATRIAEFRDAHPEEVAGILDAAMRLIEVTLSGTPEEAVSDFRSWAELEWAGKVIAGEKEAVAARKDLIESLLELAAAVAETVGKEVLDGLS
jgi:hypothetical protein